MEGLRNHGEISLLCLLSLCVASRGMPQPNIDWQQCKSASQEIVQELWKLEVKPLALEIIVPDFFPENIVCEDHCDPESLGTNKMYCLKKISQGLQHYQKLLRLFRQVQNTNDLQSALDKLLLLLQKDLDVTEGIHRSRYYRNRWEYKPLLQHTLWRLQSFSVVAARVFAHSAALNMKVQQ